LSSPKQERAAALKRSAKILSLAVLWAVIGSLQTVAQSRRTDSVNGSGAGTLRILLPVRIYRNFLVVAEGQIGGVLGGQNLVLDTGVAPSIITAKVAKQLGLTTNESTMTAVGKAIPTKMAVLPELKFGSIHVLSLPVQVQDLSKLERDIGVPVAGIIGMDVLSRASFRLDYEHKLIEFGDVSDAGVPVTFDPQVGVAIATAQLAGVTVRFVVDTGSQQLVLFGGNFPRHERFALRSTSLAGSNLGDRQLRVQELALPELAIEGHHFRVKNAYFVPDSTDPSFDGLLGVRALGCRALEYDQSRRQIYLQK
jgi:hypothetical protein